LSIVPAHAFCSAARDIDQDQVAEQDTLFGEE
jgi:hypothetical protein